MDLGSAWKVTDDEALVEARARKANCRILFDGAMRGDGTGAGGMAVILRVLNGNSEPVETAEHSLHQCASAPWTFKHGATAPIHLLRVPCH